MDRRIALIVSGLIVAFGPWPAVAADQAGSATARVWEEQRRQLEGQVAGLPSLGRRDVQEVLQFRVEDKELVLRTRLVQTSGESRVEIPQLGGYVALLVQGKDEEDLGVPQYFQFQHHGLTHPKSDVATVHTAIYARPGYIQIARDVTGATEETAISFVQWRREAGPFAESPSSSARLRVKCTDRGSGSTRLNVTVAAETLEDLRRQHPREVILHLQPILRDLHQQAVFSGDARLAWQVFADSFAPPPGLEAKLRPIVAALDDDNPLKREAAQAALVAAGQPAALYLARLDRAKLSVEQNTRIDLFLAPYQPLAAADVGRLRNEPAFLLDCLCSDEPAIRVAALARLRALVGRKIDFDPAADELTRNLAVAGLRQQIIPQP